MGGNMCYVWLRKQVPSVNVCCEHGGDVFISMLSEKRGFENRKQIEKERFVVDCLICLRLKGFVL